MYAQRLCVATLICLLLALVNGNPLKDAEDSSTSMAKGIGQKVVDKFDQVFYSLLDEAATHVTDDKKGAFKEMVIRHRGDLLHNIKENLVNKDNIQLNDVKNAVTRELQNRLELFNYVGSGVWGKVNKWYRSYCQENEKSFICFSRSAKSAPRDELEREYAR